MMQSRLSHLAGRWVVAALVLVLAITTVATVSVDARALPEDGSSSHGKGRSSDAPTSTTSSISTRTPSTTTYSPSSNSISTSILASSTGATSTSTPSTTYNPSTNAGSTDLASSKGATTVSTPSSANSGSSSSSTPNTSATSTASTPATSTTTTSTSPQATLSISPGALDQGDSVPDAGSRCATIRKRQEIRMLDIKQRDAFFVAARTMQNGPQPNRYDEFVRVHHQVTGYAHNGPLFLPWHRAFLYQFERALQDIDPSVTMPYWDWSFDSQLPVMSPVFGADYCGGNGRAGDGCVADGWLASYRPYYPKPDCLRRNFDFSTKTRNAFHSVDAVQQLINTKKTFDSFTRTLENTLHARVHTAIGGQMSTMYSAADILFFLHHGMVDKIWAMWQRTHPDLARTFSAKQHKGEYIDANHMMRPWGNVRVSEMFDTRDWCYEYAELTASAIQMSASDMPDLPPPSLDIQRDAVKVLFSKSTAPNNLNALSGLAGNSSDELPGKVVNKPSSSAPADTVSLSNLNDAEALLFNRGRKSGDSSGGTATIYLGQKDKPIDDAMIVEVISGSRANRDDAAANNPTGLSLTQIQQPPPVNEAFLNMCGANVTETRELEAEFAAMYANINAIPSYVSPCAIGNRPDVLSAILRLNDQIFSATYGDTMVNVRPSKSQVTENALQAVSNVRACAAHYANAATTDDTKRQLAEETARQVEKIIDTSLKSDVDGTNEVLLTSPLQAAGADWKESWQTGKPLWEAEKLRKDTSSDLPTIQSSDAAALPARGHVAALVMCAVTIMISIMH